MEIRPFTEADRPFLRTLFLASRKANWHWLDAESWRLEDFDRVTIGEQIWVALVEGHRAGFAAVHDNDNFLHSLFVDPAFQRCGVGSALLDVVEARFSGTGALKCLTANRQAQAFYDQRGWVRVGSGESEQGAYLLMHLRKG